MKEKFESYRWLFHAILAAVIFITAMILPFFSPERLIVTLIGLILVGFGVYRLYRLVRRATWDDALIKRINLVEMFGHVVLGLFMLYWIWGLNESLGLLLGYLIGAILIVRGVIHFYSDQNKKTNDDITIFFLHIGAIIGGSYIIFQGDFTAEVLLGFIVVMATRRSIKYALLSFNEYREKQKLTQQLSVVSASSQSSHDAITLATEEEDSTPNTEDERLH